MDKLSGMSYANDFQKSVAYAETLAGNATQTIAPEHGDPNETLTLAVAANAHAQIAIAHAIQELAAAISDSQMPRG